VTGFHGRRHFCNRKKDKVSGTKQAHTRAKNNATMAEPLEFEIVRVDRFRAIVKEEMMHEFCVGRRIDEGLETDNVVLGVDERWREFAQPKGTANEYVRLTFYGGGIKRQIK